MVTLYFATGGPGWFNSQRWLGYIHHECTWFSQSSFATGIQGKALQRFNINMDVAFANACEEEIMEYPVNSDRSSSSRGVMKHLWLYENNLKGTLPQEIFELLPSLKTMSFYVNSLAGSTIPAQIGLLENFEGLNMAKTGLSGTLPSEIGVLSKIQILALYNNQVSGAVPSEIGLLSDLIAFGLDSNQISSTIPSEVGFLSNVAVLSLFKNRMTSTIPTEVGNCRGLLNVWLHGNSLLRGAVPSEMGQLFSMQDLSLSQHFLSGTIRKFLLIFI